MIHENLPQLWDSYKAVFSGEWPSHKGYWKHHFIWGLMQLTLRPSLSLPLAFCGGFWEDTVLLPQLGQCGGGCLVQNETMDGTGDQVAEGWEVLTLER